MRERDQNLEHLRLVARQLGDLNDHVMFLGGSIVGLLLTDDAAPDVRTTKDVDVVMRASMSRQDELDEKLRGLGFKHCLDPGAPSCRWVVGDCKVDVMRVGEGINAYLDKWTPGR